MPASPRPRPLLVLLILSVACAAPAAPADAPLEARTIIDWHVHVAGLGYGGSGNFVNADLRSNYRFTFFRHWMDVDEAELEARGDQLVVMRLDRKLQQSRYVDRAVVLALDGVIDRNTGQLDRERTQIYVDNDFVLRETRKYPRLLYGASINPNREDALDRLEHAYREGAVLVKWIPSIMDIDPADTRFVPFYRKLVELDLPLLTHTGMERSFAHAKDELCDPRRLELALRSGVTVIAAHVATTGSSEGEDNFERIMPMFDEYPNLYADISSLTQVNKLGYLARALQRPGLAGRLLYGSDWPLQHFPVVSPWYHLRHVGLAGARRVSSVDNPWDRDVELKRALGVPDSVFTRAVGRVGELACEPPRGCGPGR